MYKWRMITCFFLSLLFSLIKPMDYTEDLNSEKQNYIQSLPDELKFIIVLEICRSYIDDLEPIADIVDSFQQLVLNCSLRFSCKDFYNIFDSLRTDNSCKLLLANKLKEVSGLERKIAFARFCKEAKMLDISLILVSFLTENEPMHSNYHILKCCLKEKLIVISKTKNNEDNNCLELTSEALNYQEIIDLIGNLKKGEPNDLCDNLYEQALMLSIFKRKERALESLLTTERSDNSDDNLINKLRLAAFKGQKDLLKELLNQTNSIPRQAQLNEWPLLLFAVVGRSRELLVEDVIKFLAPLQLNNKNRLTGQFPSAIANYEGHTALHVAVIYELSDIVKFLVQLKAIGDIKNSMGYTPLHLAVKYGLSNMISLLLDLGIMVDPKDYLLMTPLHLAIFNEDEFAVALLLNYGADVNAQTKHRETALHFVARYPSEQIAKIVLFYNPKIVKNIYGETALNIVSQKSSEKEKAVYNLIYNYGSSCCIS